MFEQQCPILAQLGPVLGDPERFWLDFRPCLRDFGQVRTNSSNSRGYRPDFDRWLTMFADSGAISVDTQAQIFPKETLCAQAQLK